MTSTSEIAETKILSPFFSSVVMIRRAVVESCFESERYQIHRGYPGPPPSGNIPREATPHFATGFGEVRFQIFPVVDLQRQEPPLAFEEVVPEAFQAPSVRQSS